jgi:hypothetical protein
MQTKVKLPGDKRERNDAKAIAGVANARVQASFRALYSFIVKLEVGKRRPTQKEEEAVENFAVQMAQSMTMADTYGRMRTLHEMRRRAPQVAGEHSLAFRKLTETTFAAVFAGVEDEQTLEDLHVDVSELPPPPEDTPENVAGWIELPFPEAVAAIMDREPVLADGFAAAARAYNKHSFALARATSVNIAREVRNSISLGLQQGKSAEAVGKELVDRNDGFDDAYMRTVAMTNFASAYTAGREQQMRAPAVKNAIVAHIFKSALLPSTRENHKACHNFMADPDDGLWDYLSPLLGYQCYCRKRPIFMVEAAQHGIVLGPDGKMPPAKRPDGAEPDSNYFGHRADKRFYGA